MRKINFLAIAASLALFILIVNAAEETSASLNETLSLNGDSAAVSGEQADFTPQNSIIENSSNNGNINKNPKAVTASFGVYLEIVG